MRDQTPVLSSIADAAKTLGRISHWTLRKHIASGRIRTVRFGRRVFLDAEEIERIRRDGLPSLGAGRRNQDSGPKTEINVNGEDAETCLTTRSK